ncbi:hypothetical protein HZA33_03590 [Candidatus Pacearchaeota archaeon]|nr:hypothetical protein [Candidatus Pacearchaeota archaeon]
MLQEYNENVSPEAEERLKGVMDKIYVSMIPAAKKEGNHLEHITGQGGISVIKESDGSFLKGKVEGFNVHSGRGVKEDIMIQTTVQYRDIITQVLYDHGIKYVPSCKRIGASYLYVFREYGNENQPQRIENAPEIIDEVGRTEPLIIEPFFRSGRAEQDPMLSEDLDDYRDNFEKEFDRDRAMEEVAEMYRELPTYQIRNMQSSQRESRNSERVRRFSWSPTKQFLEKMEQKGPITLDERIDFHFALEDLEV